MTKIRTLKDLLEYERLPMQSCGQHISQTCLTVSADYYILELPTALGDVRYYIEAATKQATARGHRWSGYLRMRHG